MRNEKWVMGFDIPCTQQGQVLVQTWSQGGVGIGSGVSLDDDGWEDLDDDETMTRSWNERCDLVRATRKIEKDGDKRENEAGWDQGELPWKMTGVRVRSEIWLGHDRERKKEREREWSRLSAEWATEKDDGGCERERVKKDNKRTITGNHIKGSL